MPKFFVNENQINNDVITIAGEDAHHISRSLRMAVGEHITVSDNNIFEYECVLEKFLDGCVQARIQHKREFSNEPKVKIHLFQALPKGEKMDFIIQKSVECGVFQITPFESDRCVVKVKADTEERKTDRRNKIALEAAKQCGRGIVPYVNPTVSFSRMIDIAKKADAVLFCYEGVGTEPLGKVIKELRNKVELNTISIIIGSEGGFSLSEVELVQNNGFLKIGLGKRILRAETASIFALSCLTYEFELS